MEKLIYYLWVKIWNNMDIESKLSNLVDVREKIIFDVGAFSGLFTKNFINYEKKKGYQSKYYLFDPNPNSKK